MVCVVSWWVSGCLGFPKTPPPSGRARSGARRAGPGLGRQQAAVDVVPSLSPPETALALREREGKDKERAAGWPHRAHPAGEEGRGFTGKRGRPGRQKGPWAPAFQRPGLPSLCHRAAGKACLLERRDPPPPPSLALSSSDCWNGEPPGRSTGWLQKSLQYQMRYREPFNIGQGNCC